MQRRCKQPLELQSSIVEMGGKHRGDERRGGELLTRRESANRNEGAAGQWRTQEFFSGGGVQQIQLRTEDRENGDLGAVAA